MKRLILTTGDSGAGCLKSARIADVVIGIGFQFVWGPLPSDEKLATALSPRSMEHLSRGSHWLDNLTGKGLDDARARGLSLTDFCERFETVELWIDPVPNAQLILIWLLDWLRPHQKVVSRLSWSRQAP